MEKKDIQTLNYIKFKSNNTDVKVKRGISPNVLELHENDIENTRAGKSNIDKKIEEYRDVFYVDQRKI